MWDRDLPRFGLKITPAGVKTYVIFYRIGRRSRRLAIGRHGQPWTPETARREAVRLLGLVAQRIDPAEARAADRTAPTVRELAQRVVTEHLPKRRARTGSEYQRLLDLHILPALGGRAVADVTRADVAKLHHRLAGTPMQANRVVAVMSKMFNLAERWGLRPDGSNPCRHVERFRERPRDRYLSPDELRRLGETLAAAERGPILVAGRPVLIGPFALAAIRLLLLTGARLSEVLTLRWEAVDLEHGRLHLSESKTGPKVIYLGEAARAILADLPLVEGNPYVIVGGRTGSHLVNLSKPWLAIRAAAGLPDVRPNDLRHSFASTGASALGLSLPVIGKLLGHRVPATTARYAHVAADPAQAAAEAVAGHIAAALGGNGAVSPSRLPDRPPGSSAGEAVLEGGAPLVCGPGGRWEPETGRSALAGFPGGPRPRAKMPSPVSRRSWRAFAWLVRHEGTYQHVLAAAGVDDSPARRAACGRMTTRSLRALGHAIQARPSRRGAELLP